MSPHPSSWRLLSQLAKTHLAAQWRVLLIAVACMVIGALMTSVLASYLKPIFDDIFIARKQELLGYVASGVFCVFMIKGLSEYGAEICMERVGQKMSFSLQKNLFSHVIFLNLDFFHQHHEGHLNSLLISDIRTIKISILEAIKGVFKEAFTVSVLLYVMARENIFLFLCSLIGLPFVLFLLVFCGKRVRSLSKMLSCDTSSLHIFFQQIFQNITLVKACQTENQEINILSERLRHLFKKSMHICYVRSCIHPVMEILGGVSIVIVILSGGFQVIKGMQTTGSFLTFITALLFIYRPIKHIIYCNTQLQEGLAATDRVQEVLERHPSHEHCSGPFMIQKAINFHTSLVLDKVSFGYPGMSEPLLHQLSCVFEGQKRSAIVGASGSGKSTLFYLLLRFYHADHGAIMLDHKNIRTIALEEWRKHVAFVGQDVTLFDETIAYNIAYGTPQASQKAIQQAAEMAFADEFIEKLPKGLKTKIGAGGIKLSGGQRQRISLARAFLKDAPLLLLDEATSALDNLSEKRIQEAIERLTFQRTTLIIAHRLSTIENAHCIFVMNKGCIVEQGTHHQLLNAKGLYKKLALFPDSVA